MNKKEKIQMDRVCKNYKYFPLCGNLMGKYEDWNDTCEDFEMNENE